MRRKLTITLLLILFVAVVATLLLTSCGPSKEERKQLETQGLLKPQTVEDDKGREWEIFYLYDHEMLGYMIKSNTGLVIHSPKCPECHGFIKPSALK
jgi:hypothetical protein